MFGFLSASRKSGPDGMLRIAGGGETARVEAGETLLSAALRGKIPFPHMCTVGEWGACKCRLIKGHIRLTRDISHQVSPEELSFGFVLACQSVAESEDVEVEVPGLGREPSAEPAPAQADASITRVTPLAPSILELEV